jgi:hypothetical protein
MNMKVSVRLPGSQNAPALAAFTFDKSGKHIGTFEFQKERADIDTKKARVARVLIGPAELGKERELSIATLERARAYEPAQQWQAKLDAVELLPLPEHYLQIWKYFCRVRGRVVRPVNFFGFHLTLPVCRARVHVCEVDPIQLIIPRLPEREIFRLRDDLLDKLRTPPIPFPEPEPGSFPGPWPGPRPSPFAVPLAAGMQELALNPQPLPPQELPRMAQRAINLSPAAKAAFDPQPEPPGDWLLPKLDLKPQHMLALRSDSAALIRSALLDNLVLVRPLICYLKWLWPLLRCDEVRVVDTDNQGRFDFLMFYPPKGDAPDLYFWVEYFIDGAWQTVYRPSIHCHTYWNYVCGTEVTITVTHPRVPGCWPTPGITSSLLVYGVGNIPVEGITNNGFAEGGNGDDYVAVTQRPFAGSLHLQADFPDKAVLSAKSITHFLWSRRRVGTAGDSGWEPVTEPFSRGYRVDYADDTHYSKQYPMNPESSPSPNAGRFRIPHEEPWIDVDGGIDGDWESYPFLTAVVDSPALPKRSRTDEQTLASVDDFSGEWEFKLELFKADGSRANLTAEGIGVQVQDIDNPLPGGTIPWKHIDANNRYTAGGVQLQGFVMQLAVDNNESSAQIFEARVGATSAGPCGFIEYGPGANVELAYHVRHLTHRATFAFDIFRGSAGTVEYCRERSGVASAVTYKKPGEPAASSNYTRTAYRYARLATVAEMLSPGCRQGAFGELLYVKAIATDGYQRAYWLDASAQPMAFALAPLPALPTP